MWNPDKPFNYDAVHDASVPLLSWAYGIPVIVAVLVVWLFAAALMRKKKGGAFVAFLLALLLGTGGGYVAALFLTVPNAQKSATEVETQKWVDARYGITLDAADLKQLGLGTPKVGKDSTLTIFDHKVDAYWQKVNGGWILVYGTDKSELPLAGKSIPEPEPKPETRPEPRPEIEEPVEPPQPVTPELPPVDGENDDVDVTDGDVQVTVPETPPTVKPVAPVAPNPDVTPAVPVKPTPRS